MIDITQLIKSNFHSLSWTNQCIAKKILENLTTIHEYSVSQLAQEANVSPAMIIKFSKKLGFSGFDEFKFLSKYSQIHNNPYISEINNAIISAHKQNSTSFESIAKEIKMHQQIIIFARANSANIAYDFYYKFLKVLPNISLATQSEEQLTHLLNLSSSDLLLIVSNSGNAKEIITACQQSNLQKQDNIILITNNEKATLSKFSNTILLGQQTNPYDEFSQYLPFSEKYALMYILDSIFFSYFNLYRNECTEKINNWKFHIQQKKE